MKKKATLTILLATSLFCMVSLLFAAIPPQVQLDMNLLILAEHLKKEEFGSAARVYETTDKLLAGNQLKVEPGYYYYRAETMLATDQLEKAYKSIEKYLELTGTSGRYYSNILHVLAEVERLKKQRLTSQRQHKVAEKQAEQERLAREKAAREKLQARQQQSRAERLRLEQERKARQQRINREKKKAGKIDKNTGIQFVYIEGGCFTMGSPRTEAGRDKDEGPQHKVCVDDFWMSRYEITNRQFKRFFPKHKIRKFKKQRLDKDNQPAVYLTWEEANAYARKLSRQAGFTVRLPTEAEWEYAARGGTTESRFWGDRADSACKYANVGDLSARLKWKDSNIHNCDDGYAVAAPVGSFKPNPFGLYDMLGNVWEWCGDWYDDRAYHHSREKNPTGPESGSDKVFRGGSWKGKPGEVRIAYRNANSVDSRNNDLGFRLVVPAGQ